MPFQDIIYLTEVAAFSASTAVVGISAAGIVAKFFIGTPYKRLTAVHAFSFHRRGFCLTTIRWCPKGMIFFANTFRSFVLHTASMRILIIHNFYQHPGGEDVVRSEEHTSELQSLMRIPIAVFFLK